MNLVKGYRKMLLWKQKLTCVRVLQKQLLVTVQTGRSEFEIKTHSFVHFVQPLIFLSPSSH